MVAATVLKLCGRYDFRVASCTEQLCRPKDSSAHEKKHVDYGSGCPAVSADQNVEYKNLVEEHSWCESQLNRLLEQSYVIPEDLFRKRFSKG